MLRAVAFDLWETLITETPEVSREQERVRLERIEEILRTRDFAASAGTVRDAYRDLWHRCHDLYWRNDLDVPTRRHIAHLLEALAIDPAEVAEEVMEALEEAYAMPALEIPPRVVSGAEDALRLLKQRNLALGLISNTGRTPGVVLRKVLRDLGLASYLDVMIFSNEHGECKPRRSIFDKLSEALSLRNAEVVFVGDNLYCDVYGAQSCGMRAIHFDPEIKGMAVAQPFDHSISIIPDATVRFLSDLPGVVAGLH